MVGLIISAMPLVENVGMSFIVDWSKYYGSSIFKRGPRETGYMYGYGHASLVWINSCILLFRRNELPISRLLSLHGS